MSWCAYTHSVGDGDSCGDASALYEKEGALWGIVSDGAGSVPYGAEGAHLMVSEGMNFLKNHAPAPEAFQSWVPSFLETLNDQLKQRAGGHSVHAYACTLIVFCATPIHVWAAQVGDGFLVVGNDRSDYSLLLLGEKGEHLNETHFMSEEQLTIQQTAFEGAVDFIAASTDGLEPVAIDRKGGKAHGGFFQPFHDFLRENPEAEDLKGELKGFLESKRLKDRIRDDRTLLIARPRHAV